MKVKKNFYLKRFDVSLLQTYIYIYFCKFSYTTPGEYFISSTLISSIPRLLLFFRVHAAFLVSDDVSSADIGVSDTFYIGVAFV